MEWIVIAVYCISLLFIFAFSMGQLHLTWVYLKSKGKRKALPQVQDWPHVTVQLPIYNERYVAERLINCVAQLDYPHEKLEIQVLDDSTDDTVEILSKVIQNHKEQGLEIVHIRRPVREGYKAGALAYGTSSAKGEFIAVFDADFLPQSDFLKATVPYFVDQKIGCVQTRWSHINRDYSLLTQLQAFGLDAHFTVEQTGRNLSHSFMNFNGTAGVWRKTCIADAGGWSAETLTEDLDLSYRAQLKGWEFHFTEQVEAPAELPVIIPAIKSQQYRWNKGAAETARKNLWKVLLSKNAIKTKFHAFFHLLNSSVFLALVVAAVLSIPLLLMPLDHPGFEFLFNLGRFLLLGFFSITAFYFVASRSIGEKRPVAYFLTRYPLFLTFSMGLSVHNAIAVLEGLLGRKTPFIRTPKFNVTQKTDDWKSNRYIQLKMNWQTVIEGIMCLYFIFGLLIGLSKGEFMLIVFHLMLAFGFGIIFFHSIKAYRHG